MKRGDAKKLTRLWSASPRGTAVIQMSRSGKRVVSATPMKASIANWARTPDRRMRWAIKSVRIYGSHATVELGITWHGAKLAEQLTLTKRNGAWTLAGKRFRVMQAAVTRRSGY